MSQVDALLIQAYTEFNTSQTVSVDKIICNPNHRRDLLVRIHSRFPNIPEETILHRFMNLRKTKRLPRLQRNGPGRG